jgi:hypothetical protein
MKEEKKIKEILLRTLSIIVVISVALNIILFLKRTETFPGKKKVIAENVELNNKLRKATNEINQFKGISDKIDQVVQNAERQIREKEIEITRLQRGRRLQVKENERLSSEIDSLSELYLASIDSLLVERERTKVLNASLENMNDVIQGLRNQMGVARELISDNLKVEGIKVNNQGKKQSTALAKKTDQLSVCFDLLPNKVATAGKKELYIVITSPDGDIIKDTGLKQEVFWHPEYKKEALLSKSEIIDYQNQKLGFCSTVRFDGTLKPGLYVVELFSKENKLGMSTFSLR